MEKTIYNAPDNSAALAQQSVGRLVAERPGRAQVFEKFGIEYCCGGKILLADVCHEKGLDVKHIAKEIAIYDASHPATGTDWARASLSELAGHIITAHHDYLRAALPRLTYLTDRVKNAHSTAYPDLVELDAVFNQMRAALEEHTRKEEEIVFPCIKQLERGEALGEGCSVSRAVTMLETEHTAAGDALATIRALTHDFAPPSDTCNTHRAMLFALQELETDMHQHVHKENSILFPRAVAREKELLQ